MEGIWRLLEGSTVDGKYKLVSFLGAGAHGGVYSAEHIGEEDSHRRVAVKLVERNPAHADQQLQEAANYAGLSHPSLLRSYTPGECVLQTIRFIYLPSDLADETLLPHLYAGPISLDEARDIGVCVVSALVYLHEQHRPLVHRDVKPANVMLTGGRWKLGDFGLLRSVNDQGGVRTRTITGTPEYAPPESFDGIVSPAWDIWSLAILMHEAAVGHRPFSGETPQQLMQSICSDEPNLSDSLSDEFREILNRCLDKDRTVRWNAQRMLDALEQLDTGVAVYRYEPAQPVRRSRIAENVESVPASYESTADEASEMADAEQLIVCAAGTGDCTTLVDAVRRVKPGGAITVRPGRYVGSVVLERPVEIRGDGAIDQIIVEAAGAEALTIAAANCRVAGITLRSNSDIHSGKHAGVAIRIGPAFLESCDICCNSLAAVEVAGGAADVTLLSCAIRDGRAGGVEAGAGSAVLLEKCTLTNNHGPGARAMPGSMITVSECDISAGGGAGVALEAGSAGAIVSSAIFDNEGAGVACTDGGSVTISGTAVYGNRQAGLSIRGRCSADVSDSDITANTLSGIAAAGGSVVKLLRCKVHDGRSNGIQISDGSRCTAETCEICSNGFAGVRVSQGASLKATECQLHSGKRNAAVIQDNSSAEFTDCDIHGNGQVGILIEEGGKADLIECRLHDSPEGGVQFCGTGTMERCELFNNGKPSIEAQSGGSPSIRDCNLRSNEMPGILIHGGSEAVIERCQISNNSLPGIAVGEASKVLVTDCTIRAGGQVGVVFWDHARGIVDGCRISENALDGIRIMQNSEPIISSCRVNANGQFALHLSGQAGGEVNDCDLTGNTAGPAFYEPGCTTTSNRNTV